MPENEAVDVVVVGSINADLVAQVEGLPQKGETIGALGFEQHLGGKGANQAVAAALLGARTAMVGCVGDDPAGARALQGLRRVGVDCARVRTLSNTPTGTALITVEQSGANTIVVVPGANGRLGPADLVPVQNQLINSRAVILQLEIPDPVVLAVAAILGELRHDQPRPRLVFNPSPFRETALPPPGSIDLLIVNELEAEAMSTVQVHDLAGAKAAAANLLGDLRPGGCVVITLGAQGALALADGSGPWPGFPLHVPALKVDAVDTTGAGDVFTGALVAELGAGRSLAEALRFATAAAGLTVTRAGAQSSFPQLKEVQDLLDKVAPARILED